LTEVTGKARVPTSETFDAERRRRLAAVYRLLIELSRRHDLAAMDCAVEASRADGETEAACDGLSAQGAVQT